MNFSGDPAMPLPRTLARLLPILLLLPAMVQAHTGVGATHGFAAGAGHPLGGLDHLLAMLAVGLWAMQMSRSQPARAATLWTLPLTFVGLMACGALLGATGIALPFAEQGIVLSMLLPGMLIAATVHLPLPASVLLVGLFALCHGHAHGSEMSGDAGGLAYAVGFLLTTAGLHAAGIGLGALLQRLAPAALRVLGASIALTGAYLGLA